MAARSAARGPRFYDGLVEAVADSFVWKPWADECCTVVYSCITSQTIQYSPI